MSETLKRRKQFKEEARGKRSQLVVPKVGILIDGQLHLTVK